MDRTAAVTTAALYAYADTLDAHWHFTSNRRAMAPALCAVEHEVEAGFAVPTGISAIAEQNYALNRVDYHTVKAMIADDCKFTETAAMHRKCADAWSAYFNDPARRAKAEAEEDKRVAAAEARDYRKVEDCHR